MKPLRAPTTLPWRSSVVAASSLLLLAGSVAARGGSARADTEATISRLSSASSTERRVVARPLAAAQRELAAAASAERAGDPKTASLRLELARDHARHAEAVLEASRLERGADATVRAAASAEERLVRARTAFDEALARRGRAEKRLELAEAERKRLAAPAGSATSPTSKRQGGGK